MLNGSDQAVSFLAAHGTSGNRERQQMRWHDGLELQFPWISLPTLVGGVLKTVFSTKTKGPLCHEPKMAHLASTTDG